MRRCPRNLCLRRKRLCEASLNEAKSALKNHCIDPASGRITSALAEAGMRAPIDALEEILDTYLVYDVAGDLWRPKPSKVLFRRDSDAMNRPTLNQFFFLEECVELASGLLRSLEAPSHSKLERLWLEEDERRLKVFREGRVQGISGDQVLRRAIAEIS